jgi:hypothetical protein
MEIRLLKRNENVLKRIRELAHEIDSRRLKVKRAANVIRGYFPGWHPWWERRKEEIDA